MCVCACVVCVCDCVVWCGVCMCLCIVGEMGIFDVLKKHCDCELKTG